METEQLKELLEKAKEIGRGNCYTKKYVVELVNTIPTIAADLIAEREKNEKLRHLLLDIVTINTPEAHKAAEQHLALTDAEQIEEAKRKG